MLGAVVLRRWWASAACAALLAGLAVGALHAAGVKATAVPEGRAWELSVQFTSAPRQRDGLSGRWWTATGRITAGASAATVSLAGSGDVTAAAGDTVVASMRAQPPRTRGQSSSLRVLGEPVVIRATGLPATARAQMRQVAGDGDSGWLLSGMTLGQDEGLSAQAQEDMRAAGLTHLTAVSGANCAILLVLVHWLAGWMRIPRRPRAGVSALALLGFVMTVGPQPSVLRASVMATLTLAAGLVGGKRAAAHVLQVSAIVLLLIDPWLAFSVGFILSIVATAGLIAVIDRGPLAATMAAQIATFPVLLAIGGAVGPRTVVANLLAAPLAAAVPVLGLAALGLDAVGLPGQVVASAGRWLCSLVLRVAGWDWLPALQWVPGWRGVVLAVAVSATVLVIGRRHMSLVALLVVGAIVAVVRAGDHWPPPQWWIVACDVGQGDGFVLRSAGRTVVVDAGPDPPAMAGCLDRLGVHQIDLLVVTHFHADHVDGLPGVLGGRRVAQVWTTICPEPREQYDEAMRELSGLPVATPGPGTTAQVGDMWLTVVWPQRVIDAGSVPNNASLSFLVSSPHGSAAFLGDVEPEAQRAVLAQWDLDTDIVKVPHHGSAAFVPELPTAVTPRIALIGVGEDNSFGHPTPEAIAAWQAVGAQVFTTEDNGDIAVTTDEQVAVRGVQDPPLG